MIYKSFTNLPRSTHPVDGSMMQPPRRGSFWHWQWRSAVSWFMPRLCPSSCATVDATPSTLTRWSYRAQNGWGTCPDVYLPSVIPLNISSLLNQSRSLNRSGWLHDQSHHVNSSRSVLRAHGRLRGHAYSCAIKRLTPWKKNKKQKTTPQNQ